MSQVEQQSRYNRKHKEEAKQPRLPFPVGNPYNVVNQKYKTSATQASIPPTAKQYKYGGKHRRTYRRHRRQHKRTITVSSRR